MTHLFAIFFFAAVIGTAIAALWSVFDEHRDLVLANLPWKLDRAERPRLLVHSVRRNGLAY